MKIQFDYIDFDDEKLHHLLDGIKKNHFINPSDIFTRKRKKSIAQARQMFILICATNFELPLKEIAMIFEYSETGINNALKMGTLLSEKDTIFKIRHQRILEHINL